MIKRFNPSNRVRCRGELGILSICALSVLCSTALAEGPAAGPVPARAATLRFDVLLPKEAGQKALSGRLFVTMSTKAEGEPRFSIGRTGLEAPPVIARDVAKFIPGSIASLDRTAIAFPISKLDMLPRGDFIVQAVFAINQDLRSLNSAGNFYSKVVRLRLDPLQKAPIKLALTERVGPETLPGDAQYVRYVKLPSPLLSRFWGRPMFLRAGILLPKDFAAEPTRKYPLWVRIGGLGSRYTAAGALMTEPAAGGRLPVAS